MPYLGKADCHLCDREVDVSTNVNGMAYYRCAACGNWMQTKNARGNRILSGQVRAFADPDAAPAAPQPAPPDAENPSETQLPAEPKTQPRAPKRAGFWSV